MVSSGNVEALLYTEIKKPQSLSMRQVQKHDFTVFLKTNNKKPQQTFCPVSQ